MKNFQIQKYFALFFLVFLTFSSIAFAEKGGFTFSELRLAQVSVFQKGGGNSFSGLFSWNPGYEFNNNWGLNLNLGVLPLKEKSNSIFVVLDFSALVVYEHTSFSFELGGGIQEWLSNKLPNSQISTNILFPVKFWIINKVFFGYNAVFVPNYLTHEIKLGVAIF